jgi:predicted transcriptional regulator
MSWQFEEKGIKLALRIRFLGCCSCHDIRHKTYDIRHLYILFRITSVNWCVLLILPCEVAVKSVVPAIKALMAQELVDNRGLKQGQVAEILGISQSAVSKYSNKVRGYVVAIDNVEQVRPLVGEMTTMLMDGTYQRKEFMELFCDVCKVVRKTGLACQFCAKSDPKTKIEDCGFCL